MARNKYMNQLELAHAMRDMFTFENKKYSFTDGVINKDNNLYNKLSDILHATSCGDYEYQCVVNFLDHIIEELEDENSVNGEQSNYALAFDNIDTSVWADNQVPVYNSERIAWLASNNDNIGVVDSAVAEIGNGDGIISDIGRGMYNVVQQIAVDIINLITEEVK